MTYHVSACVKKRIILKWQCKTIPRGGETRARQSTTVCYNTLSIKVWLTVFQS